MGNLVRMIRALPGDEVLVLSILRNAAAWLQSQGIDQWGIVLKPEFRPVVDRRIASGSTWFAQMKGRLVGTVSLMNKDEPVWGPRGLDGKAMYLHGLAVPREFSGKEIGSAMVCWAIVEANALKKSVRLDCMSENAKLCKYYEALGFVYVETKVFPTGLAARLYERTSSSANTCRSRVEVLKF
jgi:ribosomal protein S18 acetylase RimI-like enzyme